MPRFSLVVLTVLLAGCSTTTGPVHLVRPVSSAAPETLDCVRTQFQRMGYREVETTPGGIAVTGVRVQRASWLLKLIGFQDTANQITAMVSQGQLQVTAVSSDPANPAEGGPAPGTHANRATEQHAERIAGACS
jgi:hypothetical protein